MRAPWVIVLLALPTLAGCMSAAPGGARQVEVCLERGIEVTWHEVDLGAGFVEAARRAGWTVSTEAPRDGFPAPLDGAVALVYLWRPLAPQAQPWVSVTDGIDPGTVIFGMPAPADPAEGERLFLDFLPHVGLADAPDRHAWARALVTVVDANGVRHAPPFRDADARARPDLSEPLAALRDAPLVPSGLGAATMQAGAWEAHVRLPVHAVAVSLEEGRLTVWADEQGHFRARMPLRDFSEGMHAFQTRVGATFEALGLPPPMLRDANGGGVC